MYCTTKQTHSSYKATTEKCKFFLIVARTRTKLILAKTSHTLQETLLQNFWVSAIVYKDRRTSPIVLCIPFRSLVIGFTVNTNLSFKLVLKAEDYLFGCVGHTIGELLEHAYRVYTNICLHVVKLTTVVYYTEAAATI